MSDGYKNNLFDVIHDNIGHLCVMKTEVGSVSDRWLSDSTRQLVIENRVEEMLESNGRGLVEELLLNGFKGYSVMTDMELILDVKETISSWCGMEDMEMVFPYDVVGMEVLGEIERMIGKALEESILK